MRPSKRKEKRRQKTFSQGNASSGLHLVEAASRVLTAHREAAEEDLTAKTHLLMERGVRAEEIIWLLTPTGYNADVAADVVADIERRGARDLAQQVSIVQSCLPPGHLSCMYCGPEGLFFEAVRVHAG